MGTNNEVRLPQYGSLVSRNHCIISSTLKAATIWDLNGNQRVVTVKNYTLNGDTVSDIKLMLWPLDKAHQEGKEEETAEAETSNITIPEMLESLGNGENIIANGVIYNFQRKVFYPSGNTWICALTVKNSSQQELELRRDTVDQDTFVRAARLGDIISTTNSPITKKTFKSIQANSYSITIESGGNTYNSSKNIDFNHVFMCSETQNIIIANNKSHIINRKLCDEVPSNNTLVNAYILAS